MISKVSNLDCLLHKSDVVLQMLDADDVILEQAMQTGAALKKARDLQKAARKPRVGPRPVYLDSSHTHACAYIAAILATPNTHWSEAAQTLMHVAVSDMQTDVQVIIASHTHLRAHMVEIGQKQ